MTLDHHKYTSWVDALPMGKHVGRAVYVHVDGLDHACDELVEWLDELVERHSLTHAEFNVIKFDVSHLRVSLLNYPAFFEEGFPTLASSYSVDLSSAKVSFREYREEGNPPVLHRKELLLPLDHPDRADFEALTQAAEAAGLFQDASIIGHRLQWEEELRAKGLRVDGHALVERGEEPTEDTPQILRHRTAITRSGLSAPMKALWRHGFLDSDVEVFDYGCGRGDDIQALTEAGVHARGWDPYFRPEDPKCEADVVNIGFVINVIEDPEERRQALEGAFALTRKVLAVAALIGGRTAYERHRLFRDGVLTSIGTFQKYFTQEELGEYIADVLGREPVAIAPGVYFIFQEDETEQTFLERRQRSFGRVMAKRPMPQGTRRRRPRPKRPPRRRRRRGTKRKTRWDRWSELLDRFWIRCVELGRMADTGEFDDEEELRFRLGTPKRVWRHLQETRDCTVIDKAREARMEDISVYLALNFFERRKSFGSLPIGLRKDIRVFWGSYASAQDHAQQLLFSLADKSLIEGACVEAAKQGLGYLDGRHSLQLHSALVPSLPAVLRLYLGCATKLYGGVEEADLVKIHIQSSKVSLMSYDDFEGKPIPMLIERVKINLSRGRIDFFDYGEEFAPQPLYLKSRYLNSSFEGFEVQDHFDRQLEGADLFDFSGFGPSFEEFEQSLDHHGYRMEGFEVKRESETKATLA